MDILRDFKRIQRVYLYNHQHSPPLPTGEIKVLLLQSESSIHTFGECVYTDKSAQGIDIWRVRRRCHYYQFWDVYAAYSGSMDIRLNLGTTTKEHRSGNAKGTREYHSPMIAPQFISCVLFVCPIDYTLTFTFSAFFVAQTLESANYTNS